MTDERLHEIRTDPSTATTTEVAEIVTEVLGRRRADECALDLMKNPHASWGNILDDLTDGSMRRAIDRDDPL
jgi:hypothetical protein